MKKVLKCPQEEWISISSYFGRKGMEMPKKVALIVFLILIGISSLFCEPPAGYYDPAEGLTGNDLRLALHNIIHNHTHLSYDSKVKEVVAEADEDPDNSMNILDIYKNVSYDKTSYPDAWNLEHAWPKSYGFAVDGACNYPYSDCHHIFACDAKYNSARGQKIYDDCLSGCTTYAVIGFPEFANLANTNSWEVCPHRRGDVARALFYLDVRYEGGIHDDTGCPEPDLILTNYPNEIVDSKTNFSPAYMGILDTLLKWHTEDPVDDLERHRNDVIFKPQYQGNRNPFIDHPEWVQKIWNGGITPTPSPTPSPTPTPMPTPTPIITISPGDIVINEIDYDDPGADTHSFIELKNISQKTIDLSSIEVVGLTNSSTAIYFTYHLNSYLLDPGEYWVLGTTLDSADVAAYVHEPMTAVPAVPSIQNGPNDGVFLRLADSPDTIIDSVSYEGDTAHPAGSPDTGSAVTDTAVGLKSLSRIPDGSDTNDNAVDFSLQNASPGQANFAPQTPTPTHTATPTPTQTPTTPINPGDIIINEIDYDNPGKDTQSFIELKNTSNKTIDISQLAIVGMNVQTSYFTYKPASHLLPPGEYWTLGTRDDSTSITAVINETMTGVSAIQNGPNDGIFLHLSDSPDTIIDSVSYEGDAAHPTGSPDTGNAGTDTAVGLKSLSRIPDGNDTNDNAADFILMESTPGSDNTALPTPTPTPTPATGTCGILLR
ncbi:MAG: endonuclease [Candidatus Sumerlaeota bacterium]|nr:endonuclease [Candidatus Sumerlaeota bacterium]